MSWKRNQFDKNRKPKKKERGHKPPKRDYTENEVFEDVDKYIEHPNDFKKSKTDDFSY